VLVCVVSALSKYANNVLGIAQDENQELNRMISHLSEQFEDSTIQYKF
jgi:hypothetical protein